MSPRHPENNPTPVHIRGNSRAESAEDKSLLNSEFKTEYEVDEVYKLMGCRSRSTCLIVFLISLFGETCAPFGVIGPLFQTRIPTLTCTSGNCTVEDICNSSLDTTWEWASKHRTIVSEYNLQCHTMYTKLAPAVFFMPGMAIGLIIAGYLSDRIGRKPTNMMFMTGAVLASTALGFSVTFEMYLVFQSLLGMTLGGTMVTRVVWMLEFVAESSRPYASAISAQFFCVGTVLVAVADRYLEDWRMLDFIIAVYSVIYVLAMIWVPESPHWLVTNQKQEELTRTMEKLNNINTTKINVQEIRIIPVQKHNESGNFCIIFRDRKVLGVVLGLMYQWFLASFLYYGFFHMAGSLHGSFHWNISIMGLLEGPSLILAGLATTLLGRKKTLMSLLLVVIVTSLGSMFKLNIYQEWDMRRVLSLIGSKAGSGPMFFVVYIITLEIMPTSIRAVGMCSCSLIARVGAAIAPFFVELCNEAYLNLNYIIFIAVCVVGLIVGLALPETKGNCLKQTYDNNVIDNNKYNHVSSDNIKKSNNVVNV